MTDKTVSACDCMCHWSGSPHYASEPCCKDALVYPKPTNPPSEPMGEKWEDSKNYHWNVARAIFEYGVSKEVAQKIIADLSSSVQEAKVEEAQRTEKVIRSYIALNQQNRAYHDTEQPYKIRIEILDRLLASLKQEESK